MRESVSTSHVSLGLISPQEFIEEFHSRLLGDDPDWIFTDPKAQACAMVVWPARNSKHVSEWQVGTRRIQLEQKQILVAPPGKEKKGHGNGQFHVLLIPAQVYEQVLTFVDLEDHEEPFAMQVDGSNWYFFDFRLSDILGASFRNRPFWQLEIMVDTFCILARVFQLKLRMPVTKLPTFRQPGQEVRQRIEQLIEYLGENVAAKVNVEDMARHCFMGTSTFYREFKKVTGTTPQEMLIRLRIEKSCELLERTDRSIADIAMECGFSSVQNYYHAFRKTRKRTPGEYRARPRISGGHGAPGLR